MTDREIRDIADEVVDALNNLAAESPTWWEKVAALGPALLFLAALLAAFIAWKNLHQQKYSEARSEWWRRTQWALNASVAENTSMMTYGTQILNELARSRFADEQDKRLLDAVWSVTDTGLDEDGVDDLLEAIDLRGDLSEDEKLALKAEEGATEERPLAPTAPEGLLSRIFGPRGSSMDDPRGERDTERNDESREEAERGN